MTELEKWEPVARKYDPLKAGSIDGTDNIPHDRGIMRAMEAEYKPNKFVVGDPKATIFVGRLNPATTEETIRKARFGNILKYKPGFAYAAQAFSKYGKINKLCLVRDIVTGFSKGYAFVEYCNKYDAVEAVNKMDKRIIDDRQVFVDAECERLLPGWIPRRLGGGLSGKKESGQLRFGGVQRPFKKPLVPLKSKNRDETNPNPYGYHDPDTFSSHNPQRSDYRNRYRERERYSSHYSSGQRSRDKNHYKD